MRTTLRLWLLGSGVAKSASPAMQMAAMAEMGIAGWYRPHPVDAAGLPGALARMRAGEVDGANVTIPYKRLVAAGCDGLEGDAALLGAVNTVVAVAGSLRGHNTDAAGLEAALRHEGLWPADQPAAGDRGPAIILGAGGAAAAAGLALLRAGVDRLVVAARREQAAGELAATLRGWLPEVPAAQTRVIESVPMAATGALLDGATWLVNATPVGAGALGIEVARLRRSTVVVDLRYRPRPVDLVAAARAAGLCACDGLEMLLQQGMGSLRLWSGRRPPVEVARAALHAAVGE